MFFYDPTFLLLIPAIILAIYAQFKVNSTYAELSKVRSAKGFSGAEVGKKLLSDNGLSSIAVEEIGGNLTDNYDPRAKTLRLSQGVYRSQSVAAMGIVAHEVGHAIQDKEAYYPLGIRNNLVPVANFGSTLAFPVFFLGLIFSYPMLMDLGIIAFSIAVAFQIITLPVEFNASKRAIKILSDGGWVTQEEAGMAKRVLSAAALTYVAATAMIVLNLVRLIVLRQSRD
ncbi:MAG: zinc metallopeptidase [Candidatus Saganbacteria bacterium]|nr:zinc metallopeptidase [Candidatus Saganbacteria bacterium]